MAAGNHMCSHRHIQVIRETTPLRRAPRAQCSSRSTADGHAITLTSQAVPDVVLHYTSWEQITDDIDDARIYGGIHYRFDQDAGARQGRQVGRYVLQNLLRSVPGR